jgi:hypothetical protein
MSGAAKEMRELRRDNECIAKSSLETTACLVKEITKLRESKKRLKEKSEQLEKSFLCLSRQYDDLAQQLVDVSDELARKRKRETKKGNDVIPLTARKSMKTCAVKTHPATFAKYNKSQDY